MKTVLNQLFGVLLVLSAQHSFAATINITTSNSWTLITTGTGPGGLPGSADVVNVQSGATLTVNTSTGVCASINVGGGGNNTNSILLFNSGSQITVSGILTLSGSGQRLGTVNMTSGGTLICAGFALGANPGTWTPGTGTIQLTATNTLPATVITSFNNLIITSSSITTTGVAITVGGTFTIQNSGRFIQTFGAAVPGTTRSFGASSNYEWRTGGGVTFPSTAGITFGHLIINTAAGNNSAGGNLTTVQGDLIITNTTGGSYRLAATTSPTINITGKIQVDAGTLNFSSGTGAPTVNVTGNVVLNGGILQPAASTGVPVFNLSGDWTNNGGTFTPGTGTVNFNSTAANQNINGTATSQSFNTITVAKSSTTLSIGTSVNVTVGGTLTLTSGNFSIGSNTLTLNGAVSRTSGNLAGSNTSNLTIGGTAGSLFFASGGTNNFLKNFTINTASSATLGNALNITAYDGASSEGVLTVTGTGVLTTAGFLTIKSNVNGTARIAAGNTAGGYISGDVTVERFIPQNSSKGWRLLASTTSGQTINQAWQEGAVGGMVNPNPGFGTKITVGSGITTNLATAQAAGFDTLSPGASLFRYNATTDVLVQVAATNTGNIASEQGYFLFIRGDRSPGQFGAGAPTTSTVLRSKGSLFLGDQTAVATGTSNYGLVRNPYPSRIDMRNIVRGSNLIDAYQVWDAKLGGTYGVGGFQTFSKSGANYVVAPGGGSYGSNGSIHNFIESGAAFYIQSTTNTNNTAQVTEACKASASNTNSFRPSGILADDKRVSFTLYALNPGSDDVVDGGLVFFNDIYSNSVTVEDVRKSGNFNENFGILRDNTDLVVEKRKDVTATDSIFFKMYQLRQISYRLDFDGVNFDPAVTTAVLQDKFTSTNTTINLSLLTSYTFTVNATAGSFAQDRFRLVLSSGNTFSGTGNWTDNARWSKGVPPVSGEHAYIAAGANATLNTDFTVGGSLTMAETSTLVVSPTKTLSISGTADFAGQSVTFQSDETGYGSLGQVTGTLNGATNVTVERYVPNNGFRSWRLLSVPTYGNGQTIRQAWQEGDANPLPLQNNFADHGTQITGVFPTLAAANAAGFDNTTVQAGMLTWNGTGWSNVTSTNQPIANSKAYFLYVRGDRSKGVTGAVNNSSATTLRTNGTVYTGDQAFAVPTNNFAIVANTYPSAISFTGLTRSNVNNLFYVWDSKKQNGNSLGVYQTFSFTNSFNCLIDGGSYTLGQPNTMIESGQAFFVSGGATPGGGTLTLLESAKVSGTSGNLGFRPSAAPAKIDSRLLDANNNVLDANVIVFDKAYSDAVDTDDAPKFGNPGSNFAIETNSKILAIEGTQPVTENDVIQFRMWNLKQQDYKLEFAADMNVQSLYAILEDKYLNSSKEIDLNGTTAISFSVNDNVASSAANRFRIVFSKNKPISGLIEQGYSIAPNPVEGRTINLMFKNQPAGSYSIKIVSAEGKLVMTKVINHAGGSSNQLVVLPNGIATGNYQVEINAPGKMKTIKQLLVKNVR